MRYQYEEAKLSDEEIAEIYRNMEAKKLRQISWRELHIVLIARSRLPRWRSSDSERHAAKMQ